MRLHCAWLAVSLVGCGTKTDSASSDSAPQDNSVSEGLVLAHEAWLLVDPAIDPFPPDEPVDCPAVAYGAENGFFELETDYCAWATFQQTTRLDLSAGDPLRVVTWHLDLWAPEPYTARLLLRLGDDDVWSAEFEVPGEEGVSELEFEAPSDLPAGSDAWFHVANHGVNSWRLGDLEREAR